MVKVPDKRMIRSAWLAVDSQLDGVNANPDMMKRIIDGIKSANTEYKPICKLEFCKNY